MSITVIGVGPEAFKEMHNMTKMAGDKGRVLLYQGYGELSRNFDDVLIDVCGKFKLCSGEYPGLQICKFAGHK